MPHGVFVWSELMTNDVEAAKAFFAATVGWSFAAKPTKTGTYWLAVVDGKPVAGIMDMTGICQPGVPPHWLGYVDVDDVDARVATVRDHGGKVLKEPFDIEDVGRIALVADPTGAVLGLMTWKLPA